MNGGNMNNTDDEQAPLERIADLPREIRPRTDLWPGIAARIDSASGIRSNTARPAKPRFPVWAPALAASVLLAICAAVLLNRPWGAASVVPEGRGLADSAPAAMESPVQRAEPEPGLAVRSTADAEYVAAFREYLAIQPTAEPDLLLAPDWIRATSGVLHEAEMELAAALEQAPDDPLLQQRMASLRAQQLDWLKRMAAVERNSRRIST